MLQRQSFNLPLVPEPEAREAGQLFMDLIGNFHARWPAFVTKDGSSYLLLVMRAGDLVMNADLELCGPDGSIEFCEGDYVRDADPPTICKYEKKSEPYVRRNDCDNELGQDALQDDVVRQSFIDPMRSFRAEELERSTGLNRQWVGIEEVTHLGTLLLSGEPRRIDD